MFKLISSRCLFRSLRCCLKQVQKGLLVVPQFQQVRWKSKINIQKPRPPHNARRLFEAITQPFVLPELISHTEVCDNKRRQLLQQKTEVNPYEEFLLRQCKKMVAENRMLIVCHALPMTSETRKAARNKLMIKDMHLHYFNLSLMRRAIEGSDLINLSPYLISSNMYVVSKEPCVADLIKILRKIPELILLGGRVDNYILSKQALQACAKLPPLDVMQGQLLSVLGSPASRTRSLLGSHQQALAMNLDQYVKQCQEEGSSGSAQTKENS